VKHKKNETVKNLTGKVSRELFKFMLVEKNIIISDRYIGQSYSTLRLLSHFLQFIFVILFWLETVKMVSPKGI
jgi:hypothetical protein